MSENPVQNDDLPEDNAAELEAQFEALYIPENIDPRLLELWIAREREKIERSQRKAVPPPSRQYGRRLTRLFPAYIGIAVMCLSILLGLIQRQDPTAILQVACTAFLVYTVIGLFVGLIAERCVNDSVETLLRDIVKRSREAGQHAEASRE